MFIAAVTIIKFILTWALGNAIFIIMGPTVKTMLYDSGLWDGLPANVLAFGDMLYDMWTAMIFIIPAIILIKSWREAEQRAVEG